MIQTIEAIYQNGMFRPFNPVSEITIKDKRMSPEEILELASHIYEGLSQQDIDDIEKIALDRSNFF